jgi:putative endonuclease
MAGKINMFFVYVIISEAKGLRFYVGFSQDIQKRLTEHNSGKTKSTKGYKPWKLFYTEQFNTRIEARKREKYWKSGTGKEKIKQKWFHSSAG